MAGERYKLILGAGNCLKFIVAVLQDSGSLPVEPVLLAGQLHFGLQAAAFGDIHNDAREHQPSTRALYTAAGQYPANLFARYHNPIFFLEASLAANSSLH